MQLWFSAAGDAVAGYARFGGTWVVAGAPVCAEERLPGVVEEMEARVGAARARLLFFGAGTRLEALLATRGGSARVLLGAQPVWDPAQWPATLARKASLRAQVNRARNKGVVASEWPAEAGAGSAALERVLSDWLSTKGLPPLHFMTEAHTLGDLRDRRLFVAEREPEGVIAFLVATPIPARRGWLIEQWPRARGAPNGTINLLMDAAMRALAADGARYVTLGLAPLSERLGPSSEGQSWWLRVLLHWIRAHGRRFYNFQGLDAFKASLEPASWEPIYAVADAPRFTPSMLRAIAGVFGGGSPERLILRALAMAARREAQALSARLRHA